MTLFDFRGVGVLSLHIKQALHLLFIHISDWIFIWLSSYRQKLISDCLRELLETFRLPGESQQIARITEVFAAVYVAAGARQSNLPL
jgi:hypothetical protein